MLCGKPELARDRVAVVAHLVDVGRRAGVARLDRGGQPLDHLLARVLQYRLGVEVVPSAADRARDAAQDVVGVERLDEISAGADRQRTVGERDVIRSAHDHCRDVRMMDEHVLDEVEVRDAAELHVAEHQVKGRLGEPCTGLCRGARRRGAIAGVRQDATEPRVHRRVVVDDEHALLRHCYLLDVQHGIDRLMSGSAEPPACLPFP